MATQLGTIKRIKGFPGFNVDGFNYQSPDVVAYFLTHFHSDHTCGLHAGFKGPAPIYCSPVTAALLTNVMGVKPSMVRVVSVGETAGGRNPSVYFFFTTSRSEANSEAASTRLFISLFQATRHHHR